MKHTYGTGGVDQVASGRWRARVRDNEGRRITLGTYDTEAEAERVRHQALADLANLQKGSTGPLTIAGWGATWFAQRKRDGVRGVEKEESVWNRHVLPRLGDVVLREFSRAAGQAWLDRLAETKALCSTKGGPKGGVRVATAKTISRTTQTHALKLLRGALDGAVARGHLRVNPLAGLEISVRETAPTEDPWTYLTADEIARVHAAVLPARERTIYLVAIYAGLRAGELWGLRWEHVRLDGDAPEIEVRYSYDGPPKGGKMRRVPLLPPARAALEAWRDAQTEERARRAERRRAPIVPPAVALVFPSDDDRMRHEGDDGRWAVQTRRDKKGREYTINGYKRRAKIERDVRFHDLRHTCASHLVMGTWGVQLSLDEVRAWLGHVSTTTTQRYAHLAPDHLSRRVAAEVAPTLADLPSSPFPQDPIDPPELGLAGRGSSGNAWILGAPGGTRTPDPRLRRPTGSRTKSTGSAPLSPNPAPTVTGCAVEILTRAARQEPLAPDVVRSFVLALIAAGASGPVVVRALEPSAHQMSAVVDLAVAVLESDAATSTHKGLAAR